MGVWRVKPREVVCRTCKDVFVTEHAQQVYCGPACKERRRRHAQKLNQEVVCRQCGEAFTDSKSGGRRLYCSKKCKVAHTRAASRTGRTGKAGAAIEVEPSSHWVWSERAQGLRRHMPGTAPQLKKASGWPWVRVVNTLAWGEGRVFAVRGGVWEASR